MRRRFLLSFERAELGDDEAERAAYQTIVIIGAGPTGVKLAGASATKRSVRISSSGQPENGPTPTSRISAARDSSPGEARCNPLIPAERGPAPPR